MLAGFEPVAYELTRPHTATTPLRMITWIWWKVSNLMRFPWNFRRQTIEPYLTDWKNDSKQSDEIKANWNQATDSKKQCKRISWQWKNICDTKPTQLLREVGRKT